MTLSREAFLAQCKPRFGTSNPEHMRVPHWEAMVRSGLPASAARSAMGLEPNYSFACDQGGCRRSDPDWSFQRFGMSRTPMADGRTICVGGEHEDWYDPDFCIYNDVIVLRPAPGHASFTSECGLVEIYGYPSGVFPPTDFHSATLVNDRIVIIGRMGYDHDPAVPSTPVFSLNTSNYQIAECPSTGDSPGHICEHHAHLDAAAHAIVVRSEPPTRGTEPPPNRRQVHRLHLADHRWEMLSLNEDLRAFVFAVESPSHCIPAPQFWEFTPDNLPHTVLRCAPWSAQMLELDVRGIRITVDVHWKCARLLIEGTLPADVLHTLLHGALTRLKAQGLPWTIREVDPHAEWYQPLSAAALESLRRGSR